MEHQRWRYASRAVATFVTLLGVASTPAWSQGRADIAYPRAAHAIARGAVLTSADIVIDSTARADVVPQEMPGPGWVARRVIAAGEPLRAPAVAPPPVVQAGDTVRVVKREGAIALSARGRATASAAAGELVPVRLENGRRVEGRATPSGEVIIP